MSKSEDNEPPRGIAGLRSDGSVTRYAFTLAITTAIALAIIAFMYLLEQRTGETVARMDIPQRTAAQVYADADIVQVPALRLRALRNFTRAYPDSGEAIRAQADIDALEQNQEQDFAALTELYYDLRVTDLQKGQALNLYIAQWGEESRYAEELKSMQDKLSSSVEPGDEPSIEPITTPSQAALSGANSGNPYTGGHNSSYMAGADGLNPPIALTDGSAVSPVIIEAKVQKDATPRYPRRAQAQGIEAVVTVSMDIDREGRVQEARVIKPASGRYARDFARAATSAARRTRFRAKQINGEPVPTIGYTRIYRFEMSD